MNEEFKSVQVLGSRVHIVQMDDVSALLDKWIRERDGRCRQVIVTGYHGLWEAYKDPELKKILNSADLWVPDGIAPVIAARWRGMKQARRIPGADLMTAFFELANEKGYSSFFYGDSDDTLAALKAAVESKYPGHRVAGTFAPPFRPATPQEDAEHARMINASRPDMLWVGLGMPKQDRWVYEHLDRLDVPVAIGVGAAFSFICGKVERAPDWIGNIGLEWAYRLVKEPRKLWKRSVVEGPKFFFHMLLELMGLRKY